MVVILVHCLVGGHCGRPVDGRFRYGGRQDEQCYEDHEFGHGLQKQVVKVDRGWVGWVKKVVVFIGEVSAVNGEETRMDT